MSGITPHHRTQPCKFWAEGTCEYGDFCNFIHAGPSGWKINHPTARFEEYAPRPRQQPMPRYPPHPGKLPPHPPAGDFWCWGSNCFFLSRTFSDVTVGALGGNFVPQMVPVQIPVQMMPGPAPVLHMPPGPGPPFPHHPPPLQPQPVLLPAPKASRAGGNAHDVPKFKTVKCKFFERGTCNYGDACNFIHSTADTNTNN